MVFDAAVYPLGCAWIEKIGVAEDDRIGLEGLVNIQAQIVVGTGKLIVKGGYNTTDRAFLKAHCWVPPWPFRLLPC